MSSRRLDTSINLGIDLGTSAVKVVALTADGKVVAHGEATFATRTTLPLQAEQEPAEWLKATRRAMAQLEEQVARQQGNSWRSSIAAIGLTGQLPTLVCMTAQGPLSPAITWRDGRADAFALAKVGTKQRHSMYAQTGMPVDGRYLAPMFEFHFAERLESIVSILSAKDFLLWALTGVKVTEPSTAAGYALFDLQQGGFSHALREFWGIPARLLPPIRPANTLAGHLSAAGAQLTGLPAGIPVSTGAADSVCAAFAMGGLDAKTASISLGTSAVVLSATRVNQLDTEGRYLLTPHVEAGWYAREMDLLATGTGYRWLTDLLQCADGDIDRLAAESVAGAHGLTFTPYLAGGEQGALWNPHLKSSLLGLNLGHTRADLARAFLEGVFFELKRCIGVLLETAPLERVQVSGNIVASAASLAMLADILNLPVRAVTAKSPAAVGAALLARRAAGQSTDLTQEPSEDNVTLPHADRAAAYATIYRTYVRRSTPFE